MRGRFWHYSGAKQQSLWDGQKTSQKAERAASGRGRKEQRPARPCGMLVKRSTSHTPHGAHDHS